MIQDASKLLRVSVTLLKSGSEMSVCITCFSSWRSLETHCSGHFFNPNEPWDRIYGRKTLDAARKKWEDSRVIDCEFYTTAASTLEKAICWAVERPLYVWAKQRINESYMRESLFCVCEEGFVLVADERTLYTAYFPAAFSKNPSRHQLFASAWKDVRRKLLVREYPDNKHGKRVENVEREWISPRNWEVCPNPHRVAKKPRKRRDEGWYETFERRYGQWEDAGA